VVSKCRVVYLIAYAILGAEQYCSILLTYEIQSQHVRHEVFMAMEIQGMVF
jgi:hypothetical protein